TLLGERTVTLVMVEEALHGIVGHKNICETVVVVIGERYSQPFTIGIGHASLGRYVGERTVPVVVIEDVGNAIVIVRMTVRAVTRPSLSAIAVGLKAPINVAGDEKIELAIVVI